MSSWCISGHSTGHRRRTSRQCEERDRARSEPHMSAVRLPTARALRLCAGRERHARPEGTHGGPLQGTVCSHALRGLRRKHRLNETTDVSTLRPVNGRYRRSLYMPIVADSLCPSGISLN